MPKQTVAVILTAAFLLSGCWNANELTDVYIISAVGIDKTEAAQYQLSFQIINAGEVAVGQEGSARNAATTVVYTSTGNTIFEAIRKMAMQLPRKIYFPHTSLILISEQFAKEDGIEKAMDWFERDAEFRTYVQVLIARGDTAESILKVQSPVERIAAKNIADQLETTESVWGEYHASGIDDIIRDLVNKGKEVTLSGVQLSGDQEEGQTMENIQDASPVARVRLSGLAIFKNGALARWLDGPEARGRNWITGDIESTVISLPCSHHQTEWIAIEVIRAKAKVQSKLEANNPAIDVVISLEGNIGEVNCPMDITISDNIFQLEKQLAKEIRKEVMNAITIAQDEKADIFGFGNVMQRQHPKYWKQAEEEWSDIFSSIDVNVDVRAYIRRTGMRTNSFFEEAKKHKSTE